jgi:hypothetical protein
MAREPLIWPAEHFDARFGRAPALSERQLMERVGCSPLFRRFVGLALDAPVWDATTFSKTRDHLLDGEVAQPPVRAADVG